MAHRKTLNATQVAVLRWISDGCPGNGVDNIPTRISAGALRNRPRRLESLPTLVLMASEP